jgi:acetolactate synthase-1/2/3 large subunit
VVCFSGDGSLMMNIQEMATAAEEGLNVKIVLMNNQSLGLVHQQQDMFFQKRIFAADYRYSANFLAIAAGFGFATCDLNAAADPQAALQEMLNQPGPALIHVLIDANEKVLPIVPPGAANIDMIGD